MNCMVKGEHVGVHSVLVVSNMHKNVCWEIERYNCVVDMWKRSLTTAGHMTPFLQAVYLHLPYL